MAIAKVIGKVILLAIGITLVLAYVWTAMGTAGAQTQPGGDLQTPEIIGGTCEDGNVIAILTATEAGAYSFREVNADGRISNPLLPATQAERGDKLMLEGPWLTHGEGAAFIVVYAGYDDTAVLQHVVSADIIRPTAGWCQAHGHDTEIIYGTP